MDSHHKDLMSKKFLPLPQTNKRNKKRKMETKISQDDNAEEAAKMY